jgi:CCR4-NOT transcription complex subunit 9
VITFLLSTEIIPLCLKIMEQGSELSKTVATFILQKILTDDTGLAYICQTYERFSHVAKVLGLMVLNLAKEPSSRLLKHVVRCYLRLSDNPRAKEALKACLPDQLKDNTFMDCLKDDVSTKKWLAQLIKNLEPFTPISSVNLQGNSALGAGTANLPIHLQAAAASALQQQLQPSLSPSQFNEPYNLIK